MTVSVSSARVECVVPTRDQLGETPLWDESSQLLWWLDIERPKLQWYNPETGAHRWVGLPGTYAGSQALTKDGRRLVAIDLELQWLEVEEGRFTHFATVETGLDNRLNDGRVDPRGRLWIGTMDNGLATPNGSLYRVDPDGTVTRIAGDVIVSNGIAFSPDGKVLYFTDTRRYQTWAFDVDPEDGTVTNRRLFADYSDIRDRPDGACVDVDGCIWQAFFAGGRVVRYRPDGQIDMRIELPVKNPTCVCFGGTDLKTLYVTTATKFMTPEEREAQPLSGALLAIHGVGQGMPENRFG